MSTLTDKDRLNLQEMVNKYDAKDNTEKIRNLKHSRIIRDNVETLLNLKKKYTRMSVTDKNQFEKILISRCNFLWNNYTNIFNRLLKDEININILYKFIDKLRDIEDGIIDQHSASVDVGKVLKEMYVDSALRREKKFEQTENHEKEKERKPRHDISWNKFNASLSLNNK